MSIHPFFNNNQMCSTFVVKFTYFLFLFRLLSHTENPRGILYDISKAHILRNLGNFSNFKLVWKTLQEQFLKGFFQCTEVNKYKNNF